LVRCVVDLAILRMILKPNLDLYNQGNELISNVSVKLTTISCYYYCGTEIDFKDPYGTSCTSIQLRGLHSNAYTIPWTIPDILNYFDIIATIQDCGRSI
jgi:hypothetical protein